MKYSNLSKRRWLVLLASCLINFCVGSLYAWSVFAAPMAEHISALRGSTVTAADLSIVFSLANAVGPITMITGGLLNDRFGPRWVILGGGLMFGGGMVLAGGAGSIGGLIASYSLCTGLGLSFVYGCVISNAVKFFPDHRGLIGGLTTAAYGISSVLLPPVASALIDLVGVCSTFRILGAFFMLVISVSSFFIIRCPLHFTPDNWTPVLNTGGEIHEVNKTWREMLQDSSFYIMLFMLTCGASLGMMVISQASPMAQEISGATVSQATLIVSVLSLFNVGGRLAAGYLSDRIGRINTLIGALFLALLGLVLLSLSGNAGRIVFILGICLVGVCFGSWMGVFPGFTADQFGIKHNSVNYGIMFIGFAAGGILGPGIMRTMLKRTGSYQAAFFLAMALAVLGICLCFLWKKKNTRQITP